MDLNLADKAVRKQALQPLIQQLVASILSILGYISAYLLPYFDAKVVKY